MRRLLWLTDPPREIPTAPWAADLEVETLVGALNATGRDAVLVRGVLIALSTDLDTIRYRQAILTDLLDAPALQVAMTELLPALRTLGGAGRDLLWTAERSLLSAARRLGELDVYVSTVEQLRVAMAASPLSSVGWRALQEEIEGVARDPLFERLTAELPTLREPLEQLSSVTLGVNLDAELRPTGATLLSINRERFEGPRSLLGRLFGGDDNLGPRGLTPLYPDANGAQSSFGKQLLRDLEGVVSEVGEALAAGVARYNRLTGAALAPLREDFAFYLGAVNLVSQLREAGLPVAMPELRPVADRHTELHDLYDASLALRLLAQGEAAEVVPNDALLDGTGRIAILTGPNRGGKTTFTRAVGLAHLLAQAGLPVPARAATLSPVHGIFTHFASGESHIVGYGRFDQAVHELSQIFEHAQPESLILLNEPLSGTSPREALQLARGVVQGCQQLGARAILATHLHDLAAEAPQLSAAHPASPVISLVASPSQEGSSREMRRSFRILRAPPLGESRALEIARQHGLTPEQLRARLAARGIKG